MFDISVQWSLRGSDVPNATWILSRRTLCCSLSVPLLDAALLGVIQSWLPEKPSFVLLGCLKKLFPVQYEQPVTTRKHKIADQKGISAQLGFPVLPLHSISPGFDRSRTIRF